MKPFDLEKALAGEPVVTRDGRKVTQLHMFNCDECLIYPLYGVVFENLEKWKRDGKYNIREESQNDLFMAEKEMCCWVNVYQNGYHKNYLFVGDSYGSKKTALENIQNITNIEKHKYIKTIKIK